MAGRTQARHARRSTDGHRSHAADVGLVCSHVSFRYGRTQVLHDVSFSIGRGVTGLLGANGAGKTTLLNVLSTLRRPHEGHVVVAGHDASDARGRESARAGLGYLPQRFELMGCSTLEDNVAYAAWAHGLREDLIPRAVDDALAAVDLLDRRGMRARQLSGGQRQRLAIACATAHRPEVILLDEPTAGVDPMQRANIRTMVARLGERATVLLSTHIIDDVSRGADRLLIMVDGGIAYAGDIAGSDGVGGPGGIADGVGTLGNDEDRTRAIEELFLRISARG
ncbi:ABC transporter ATP-binding protein [Bifidobacterium sp. DSM 109958]|uniref:ABC transporter ATP-binding protein n=1 Tax=Bifidobacterium moraviense TaxID=2675323 RepID=A0A7Y0F365_9BIFI|nr:ATP-binding cassette domain-containing protein [Bifidobacterium sp. DSM 109958]NMN01173.1 ABC transporter ATP-binding protein [Bifidobacterium sp. DSM 109958]